MLGPHITLLSLLISVIRGYLPSTDLTNSIVSPYENLIEKEDVLLPEETSAEVEEPSASPYRNRLTFRRRNTHVVPTSLGISSSPFNRLNYKNGYGTNRRGSFSRNVNYPSYTGGNVYGFKQGNPYSTGLIKSNRNYGYYGSTAALRNKNYKPPQFSSYYGNRPSNDLLSSFNPSSYGSIPTPKFGMPPAAYIPQVPKRELPGAYGYNQFQPETFAPYGSGDFAGRILSNRWNDKVNGGEDTNDLDGYAKKKSSRS